MKVCAPITGDGQLDHRWGRADRVVLAELVNGQITGWDEREVGWSALHDQGTGGAHHARVVTFLREHGVEAVVAAGMGAGMHHTLQKMGLRVYLGAAGDARAAITGSARAGSAGAGPGAPPVPPAP